jgi:hypothetical protein
MAVEQWTDERLDKLAELAERNSLAIERNSLAIEKLTKESERSAQESKELNIRFTAYQQASQRGVNLAFGLLATATITTIVSAVVRR